MLKIVVTWWFFIFLISCFYSGDLISISITTKILIFLFILMLMLGGLFSKLIYVKKNKVNSPNNRNNFSVIKPEVDKINYFVYSLLAYYLFLFFLLIKLIVVNGSDILVYVRIIVFSDDFALNPFFRSALHIFIHRIIIIPSILVLYIIGLKNHFLFSKNKIFRISIILLLIDSIIMFGRLNIYYMLLMYFFSAFFTSKYKSIVVFVLNKIKFRTVVLIVIFFSIFLGLTILRSVDNSEVITSSITSFLEYNVVGFRIFDVNLWDSKSLIHIHTFGRSFLGQIDSIFSILYRLCIDNTFLPANSENGKMLDTPIDIGVTEIKEANAFGTIFFTLFRDFGYFGIIFCPLVLGFIINRNDLKFKLTNNPKYFIIGLLFVYASVFSVYQSVFEGVFWPMYLILFLSIKKNSFFKPKKM